MANAITINTTVSSGGVINSTFRPSSTIISSITAGGQGPPGVVTGYFDVQAYGALGDGIHNDTVSIQNAINAAHTAGGGIVFFPTGTYLIDHALTLYTGIDILGSGSEATLINQTSHTEAGLYAMDAASINVESILIEGPSTGSGVGINFAWTAAGNVPFLNFKDVWVRNFGGDGIALETPIVSHFDRVISQGNGGYGFNLYHAGTSCTFTSCWARDNAQAGYHFYQSVYMALTACAADGNGIGYLVESAQSIGFFSCGAENQVVNGVTWDGTAFKISNSSVVGIYDAWVTGNNAVGIWITNGSIATEIFGAADNSPAGGATAFVQTDVATNTTLSDVHNTTANNYSPGTVTVINDGANGMLTKYLTVKDSSGSMILTAAPDGGEYNLKVDTTGTLALFGQGGQSLNVALLDGTLTLSGDPTLALQAATKQYVDNQAALDAINRTITLINTNTNAGSTAKQDYVYLVSLSPTLTLPTAIGNTNRYTVTNVGLGIPLVATSLSQTINGSVSAALTIPNMSLDFISDGANWRVE